MLCAYTMAVGSVRASRRLFARFFSALQHAPMLFFDSTPRGRILNRAADDISCIDRVMPFTVRSMINCVIACFESIFVISFVTPRFLLALPPLVAVYYFIQVKRCHLLTELMHCWLWLCSCWKHILMMKLSRGLFAYSMLRCLKRLI